MTDAVTAVIASPPHIQAYTARRNAVTRSSTGHAAPNGASGVISKRAMWTPRQALVAD